MQISNLIATSLPFLMAYALLALEFGMRPLAENTLKTLLPEKRVLEGWPRDVAINLALHFYRQFSFIGSAFLATASALAFTIGSKDKQLTAVAVTFIVIIVAVVWVFRWQPLARAADERLHAKYDNEMKMASIGTTSIMLALSLYAIV